jgi:hypothetical protein
MRGYSGWLYVDMVQDSASGDVAATQQTFFENSGDQFIP